MFLVRDKVDFGIWIKQERDKNEWSQSDLARQSGLNRAVINKVENGISKPMPDTCNAIARAFRIPPEFVMRKAGLLPPQPKNNTFIEKLMHLASQLPEDQIDELADIAENKLERIERQKAAQAKARPKPAEG